MSKRDMIDDVVIENMQKIIDTIPYQYHFKIHRMHNIKVPKTWQIEKDRRNEDLHLLFVKDGNGCYDLKGKKEQLSSGKVIFVSNDFPHSALPDPEHLPSIMPIRFGIYSNLTFEQVDLFSKPFYLATIPDSMMNFRKKFEQLNQYYLNSDLVGHEQICSAILVEIFVELINGFMSTNQVFRDERIEHMKKRLDDNPDHRISLNQWIEEAGISKKQYNRLFRKYYGVTPKQYQIKAITSYAEFLLKDTCLTVTEVAKKLGYPDPYTFSKQYKQVTGISPGAVKR